MNFDAGTGGTQRSGNNPSMSSSSGGDFDPGDPIGSFIRTARNILLNPRRFFQSIARRGDYVGPLVFALICAAMSGMLSGIMGFLLTLIGGDIDTAVLVLVGNVIAVFIRVAISLVIGAGIWHLLVLLLVGPSNAGFEATFRVAAYASAIQLITWVAAIPIVGTVIALIAGVYGLYVAYFGIQEIRSSTRQRAAAVIALPLLTVILLGIVTAIIISVLLSMG